MTSPQSPTTTPKAIHKLPPRLRQFYVALGPILITISLGMAEGFSAILLPQLKASDFMELDEDLSSWIASMAALPMALGCILGGVLMEKIGRKTVHMLTCFPCIIGWMVLYFSYNATMILTGRFFTGFCVGLLGPPTGVYMSETSEPKFRGFLLASISFAISMGLFISHILGTFITWQSVALVGCVFPVLCLVTMAFAPESPTFLAKQNKLVQAREAFLWCRGDGKQAMEEVGVLEERQKALNAASKTTWIEDLKTLRLPEFYKPLSIIVVFFITMQCTGHNAIAFYCVDIMKQTLGDSFDEYLSMIIIDSIRLGMSILACYILKKIGRRPLALLSGFGVISSLLTLSAFTFFCKTHQELIHHSYIPLAAFVFYMSFVTVGFVPLPWTMMGEVFPLVNRGMGSGISAMVNYMMIFLVVKTTPGLFLNLGTDGAFLLYAVLCSVGMVVLVLFLPETKDKALYEIEDRFKEEKSPQ